MEKVGYRFTTKEGCKATVIEYKNGRNVKIVFDDYGIEKVTRWDNCLSGHIKNPMFPTHFGVGYIGIGNYKPKDHKDAYKKWECMIARCYDKRENKKNYNTYKDCIVCDEWHNFQNFAEWYYNNKKDDNSIIWDLDKDILAKGNKVYSPEYCALIPHELNNVMTKRDAKRGQCFIGVCLTKNGKYQSQVNQDGKQKYLGVYDTEEEAFLVYKYEKEKIIKETANKYRNFIDDNVYNALIKYEVDIDD